MAFPEGVTRIVAHGRSPAGNDAQEILIRNLILAVES
jgi:hypothetical protein